MICYYTGVLVKSYIITGCYDSSAASGKYKLQNSELRTQNSNCSSTGNTINNMEVTMIRDKFITDIPRTSLSKIHVLLQCLFINKCDPPRSHQTKKAYSSLARHDYIVGDSKNDGLDGRKKID